MSQDSTPSGGAPPQPDGLRSTAGMSTLGGGRLVAGRYRIQRRLARGGQAQVYLAHQEPLNRPVALKVLMPPAGSTESEIEAFQARFLLEAKTLASLVHPNIVVVHDYGETDQGEVFIAMEYIDGLQFNELLRGGRLKPARAFRLMRQVGLALRYAHSKGVVHRYIKNSNILVTSDDNGAEQVKVVDFGIAKLMNKDTSITRVGLILGSPHFMAPEQAKGIEFDHRVDIYAVGVLLYCGLVGRYPFTGPHSTAILTAHLTQAVPRFHDIDPDLDLPPVIEEVVRRCLAKDPAERYRSMDEVLNALDHAAEAIGLPFGGGADTGPTIATESVAAPTATASTRSRDAWRIRWISLAVGAVLASFMLLFLLLGLILYFEYQRSGWSLSEQTPPDRASGLKADEARGDEARGDDGRLDDGRGGAPSQAALAEDPATDPAGAGAAGEPGGSAGRGTAGGQRSAASDPGGSARGNGSAGRGESTGQTSATGATSAQRGSSPGGTADAASRPPEARTRTTHSVGTPAGSDTRSPWAEDGGEGGEDLDGGDIEGSGATGRGAATEEQTPQADGSRGSIGGSDLKDPWED